MATITLNCGGSGGGGGNFTCSSLATCSITNLSDVASLTPAVGDVLTWSGANYEPLPAASDAIAEWSWFDSGPVFPTVQSSIRVARADGRLVGFAASLGTVGTSATQVSVYRNGVLMYTGGLVAGDTSDLDLFTGQDFFQADEISIEVVTAGTNAEDLGVQVFYQYT